MCAGGRSGTQSSGLRSAGFQFGGLKRGQGILSDACAGMVRTEDSLSVGQQIAVRLLPVLVLAPRRDLRPISYRVVSVSRVVGAGTRVLW